MAPKRQVSDAWSTTTNRRTKEEKEVTGPLMCPHGFTLATHLQRQRYTRLARRQIVPTKFMDAEVLDTLGMRGDFDWFLPDMGWTVFMNAHEQTYARLTLEFLTSVDADRPEELQEGQEGRISFRLGNAEHNLSFSELRSIFGLPSDGMRHTPAYDQFSIIHWWDAITVPDSPSFSHNGNEVSLMPNPVFRYLHRIINESFIGNGDSSQIARFDELLYMATTIYNFKMDTGATLAGHFVRVAEGRLGYAGPIIIGGRITTIARYLGVNFQGLEPLPGKTLVDLQCCVDSGIVEEENGAYFLPEQPHMERPRIRLPIPPRTTICDDRNWRYPGFRHR